MGAICRAQPPVATAGFGLACRCASSMGTQHSWGGRSLYTATPVSFANAMQARRWRGAWAVLEAS